MRELRSLWIGALCFLAVTGTAAAQSAIELRPSAKITPGSPVMLSHVARLVGAEAVALGGVVIRDTSHAEPGTVTLDEVQRALNAAGKVNWGRIEIRGSSCTLVGRVAMKVRAHAAGAAAPEQPSETGAASDAGTVRGAIVARVAQLVHAEAEDLKVSFSRQDDEFLAISTAGRTVEVRATAEADRLPLAVTVFEGDRIVDEPRTVRVGVQVRRSVVTVNTAIRRGQAIGTSDVQMEERWLGPTAKPASMDQLAGAVARARLNAGDAVMAEDVAPGSVVSKGDVVVIRCVSGSVALTTRGRALADGCDGDTVEFQALDSKRIFRARMSGKGRAVVSSDGTEHQQTPEPGQRRQESMR